MIARILGEGQWRLAESDLEQLNELDEGVSAAIDGNDQQALTDALGKLGALVRELGQELADDELLDSDLIIPDLSASLDEVRAILDESQDGLIPG